MKSMEIAAEPSIHEQRLLRIKDVMKLSGLSKSYIYALSADGRFPQSIQLVPRGTSRAWVYSEIQDWINNRISARDIESTMKENPA